MKVYTTYYEESAEIEPKVYALPILAYSHMLRELEDDLSLVAFWGNKKNREFISEQITKLKESYKTNHKEFGCDICWCVEREDYNGDSI